MSFLILMTKSIIITASLKEYSTEWQHHSKIHSPHTGDGCPLRHYNVYVPKESVSFRPNLEKTLVSPSARRLQLCNFDGHFAPRKCGIFYDLHLQHHISAVKCCARAWRSRCATIDHLRGNRLWALCMISDDALQDRLRGGRNHRVDVCAHVLHIHLQVAMFFAWSWLVTPIRHAQL